MGRLIRYGLPLLMVLLFTWGAYGLYGLAEEKHRYVVANEGLTIQQDEALHRSISREVTLDLYQKTNQLVLAEGITLMMGGAKEVWDFVSGKPMSARDIEADWQGTQDARRIVVARQIK